MGVDTKLYLSTRWEADDIKTVLERTSGETVTVRSNHGIAVGFYSFDVGNRSIWVHLNYHTAVGPLTMLAMRADEESHLLLRRVALTLGGLFMRYDSDEQCELIEGAMNEHDGLPYFVKYAIVNDGIDPRDIDALAESKKRWHEHVSL